MENSIMTLVVVFIGASIILAVGVNILGNAESGFDCSEITNANWAKACKDVAMQSQQSFNLMTVILIVVAAVAILVVIRML